LKIRARDTPHGGMTPKLAPQTAHSSIEKVVEVLEGRNTTTNLSLPEIQTPSSTPIKTVATMPVESETTTDTPAALSEKSEVNRTQEMIQLENGTENAKSFFGFAPSIQKDQVPFLVKPSKNFKLFGEKENVASVDIYFRPEVEIGVTIRAGLLKKKFETQYFLLDCPSGMQLETTDRLSLKEGVGRLLSLDESQIQILKSLAPDRDQSLVEVASRSKILDEQARRILRNLEEKRLVRSTKLGRFKMFRRLIDLPNIQLSRDSSLGGLVRLSLSPPNVPDSPEQSSPQISYDAKIQESKLKEEQIREIVKGLWEGADVEGFRTFYYPLYRVEMVSKQNGALRTIWLDGRSGKEVILA
jgi:hypothetical protein